MMRDASYRATLRRQRTALAGSTLLLLGISLMALPAPSQEPDFDHIATRFLLTGSHENVRCEACHIAGVFRGTPTDCAFCHDGTGMRAESGKPLDHVPTSNQCADCHTTATWEQVRFDHAAVTGTCASCHNGFIAPGKPTDHILTSADCNMCHIDVAWNTIRFDHSGVTGSCSSCHDGIQAKGKPNEHIQTNADCDLCHSTSAWRPARFDHSSVTQPCSSCHNGIAATGKTGGHIQTNAECDLCHTTSAWRPASFDHSAITGSCSSCHNGIAATGIPAGHFLSSSECDVCHTTDRWAPDVFRHMSANYPGDHRNDLACTRCHTANSDPVQWPFPSLQPDCAACHRSNFRPDPHKKYENPDAFYTVEELRDCSGSCHIYTDATLTTIKQSRNGEHRVSDGSF